MPTRHGNETMLKIIKYIILLLLVLAMIYFLRVSFKNNSMEIKLKNPQKIEDLKQKTIELKNEFNLLNKQKNQEPRKTEASPEKKQKPAGSAQEPDKQELDKFIKENSN